MKGSSLVLVGAAFCLTLATGISIRSSLTDLYWQRNNMDAVLWLTPGHAPARTLRAAPGDLEQAADLAPTRPVALIDLALQSERQGDLPMARRRLEEAMRRDVTYRPRWAMINFLTRHGKPADVLRTAAPAAAMYEGDLTALFDLCLRNGASPEQVYRSIVPSRAKAQREYLELLIRRGEQTAGLPAALRLADLAQPRDRDLLFNYCDQLMQAGASLKVAQLWRTLPRFGAAGGRCLDWKRQPVDGITVVELGETVARLELNGRQPESATILRRPMVVEPGRLYHLRALVAGDDTSRAAVEWRWNGVVVGTGERNDMEVAGSRAICELELAIHRRPGQRSAEGSVEITNIRLEPKAAALARGHFTDHAGSLAVWRPTNFQALPSLTHIIMK
jgi:hypothetical protein